MYILSIETTFSAAHQIKGHKGSCKRLHGHNWKVHVEICTDQLNDIGIAIDFKDLHKLTREILQEFDHQYINEMPAFKEINPTAENLARYIYEKMEQKLPDPVRMIQVSLWEGEKNCVRFRK